MALSVFSGRQKWDEKDPRAAKSFQPAQRQLDEDLRTDRRVPQASNSIQLEDKKRGNQGKSPE